MKKTLLLSLSLLLLAATASAQPKLRQGGIPRQRLDATLQLAPAFTPTTLPNLPYTSDGTTSGAQQVKRKADSYTWTSIGTGTYREDIMTTAYTVENVVYEVEIEEAEESPGFYRLVYPYGEAYPYNEEGDYDTTAVYYMYIDATDPDYVYILDSYQGLDWGDYGMLQVNSYAYYYLEYGYDLDNVVALYPELFGTLENGVITMPDYYVLVGFEDLEYWYYANQNGLFAVALPGYDIADYSVEFFVTGQTTNAFGKEFVTGDLYLGTDVSYVAYAVAESYDDIYTVYAAILDGSTTYSTATGEGELKISRTETGNSYLILVAYDDEGNAQTAIYTSLPFVSTLDTWTQVGTGVFNYGVEDPWDIGYVYYATVSDSTAVLYQNDSHDTYYQIKPWGSNEDMGLVFEHDKSTNLIYVYHWSTGETYGSYGTVFVSDYVSYTGYTGYYDSSYTTVGSTYTFYFYFYVYEGGITFEKETFQLLENTGIKGVTADELGTTGTISIYDAAGRLLGTADAANFDIQSLPADKGVLILKNGDQVQKVIR